MKKLGIRRTTSRQYVDKNKAVIEREIRTVLEGARANLVQSGLPERYWPLASEHHCMALHTTTRLDNGKVPWQLRFGEDFSGMQIPFGAKVLFWNNPKLKAPKISKFSPTAAEGIFLGYHIQPGFIWKEEYLVAPLDKIEGAIEANDLKIIRSKKVELLHGDFVFPLTHGLEALGNQKPPQLDQNANVRPAGVEANEDADLAEYAPSDDEDEAKGSSEPGPIDPPPSEAPRPKTGWDPFKMPDGSPVPKGYNYDGTRLVRNKRGSARPLDTPSSAWVMMSQKDRAADIERYRKKLEAQKEAEYQELKKAAPAMPVTHGRVECHRERFAHLCVDKLGDIADSMYALVAKILQQPEIQRTPAAKAALDKEWQKLVDKGCWIEKQVREYDQVASEAQKKKLKVHFGRVFEICTLKGSELKEGDPNRKYKGRSVFQGNKVLDENSDHALFAELGSSPASMEAGKIIDVYGSQPGFTKQQADARQAYTQALFKGTETWVRLPRNRWPKAWSKMKDPVSPLRLALYGHPDSGASEGFGNSIVLRNSLRLVSSLSYLIFGLRYSITPNWTSSWLFTLMTLRWLDRKRTWQRDGNCSRNSSIWTPLKYWADTLVACITKNPKSSCQLLLTRSTRSLRKALSLQLLLSGMKIIGISILRTCWLLSIIVTLVSVFICSHRGRRFHVSHHDYV